MKARMRFLGTAAVEVLTTDDKRIIIDPYLDENPVSPLRVDDLDRLDLLIVTHAAYDHLGDAEAILRRFPDLPLICGADVRGYLAKCGIDRERLIAVPWGMMIEQSGVRVRPVYSRHWSYIEHADGSAFSSVPLGVIVDAGGGVRVYHAGDSCLYSDMKLYGELYRPTVGFINVGVPVRHQGGKHGVAEYLTGEMDATEGALCAEWLGLSYAVPVHHDDPSLPEIRKFQRLLQEKHDADPTAPKPVVLAPGEWLEVEGVGV